MRFLASLAEDVEEWLGGRPSEMDEDHTAWLAANMLALTAPGYLESFNRQLRALNAKGSSDLAAKLHDLRQVLCWASTSHDLKPDIDIGLTHTDSVFIDDALEKRDSIKEVLARRLPHAAAGARRRETYERVLGLLVPLATRIEILDPYAGDAIADMDPMRAAERTWLLRKFMQDAPRCTIKILTEIQPEAHNHPLGERGRIQRLNETSTAMLDAAPSFKGRLYISVRRPHPLFHERMVRLLFESGAIAFRLDRGIDTFRNEKFISAEDFDYRPSGRFTSYVGQIKSGTSEVTPEFEVARN